MLQLEEAKKVLEEASLFIQDTEIVPLLNAVGRVLAEDAAAKADQPPFPRSPLDGYAVKGEDTKGLTRVCSKRFQVIGKIYAGEVFDGVVEHGQAVRLMTGAPIPEGANTVIRQEWTDFGEDVVEIYGESEPYRDYCYQGEDYKKGNILLEKGMVLDGIAISILASLGIDQVEVYRMPKVAVISSGDEVIQPGQQLLPGKIYDSNLHFICGRLIELGIQPYLAKHCVDSPKHMVEELRNIADEVDLIITTGGVSVGEKDIMHEVVKLLDAKQLFWRVSLKPGAPTLAMEYQDTPIVCLSGNPFGATVNFELLVRGMLAKMSGNRRFEMQKKQAVMQSDFLKKSGVRRFLRAYTQNGKVSLPKGNHASGTLSSMIGCNCLVEIPEKQNGAKKGDQVWVHLL